MGSVILLPAIRRLLVLVSAEQSGFDLSFPTCRFIFQIRKSCPVSKLSSPNITSSLRTYMQTKRPKMDLYLWLRIVFWCSLSLCARHVRNFVELSAGGPANLISKRLFSGGILPLKYVKNCFLTIIVYMLAVQSIDLFNFICFRPFYRELCFVAYRLAITSIVNISHSQTGYMVTHPSA